MTFLNMNKRGEGTNVSSGSVNAAHWIGGILNFPPVGVPADIPGHCYRIGNPLLCIDESYELSGSDR